MGPCTEMDVELTSCFAQKQSFCVSNKLRISNFGFDVRFGATHEGCSNVASKSSSPLHNDGSDWHELLQGSIDMSYCQCERKESTLNQNPY